MGSMDWNAYTSYARLSVRNTKSAIKTLMLSRLHPTGLSSGIKILALALAALLLLGALWPMAGQGLPATLQDSTGQRLSEGGGQQAAPSGAGSLFMPPNQATGTEDNGVTITEEATEDVTATTPAPDETDTATATTPAPDETETTTTTTTAAPTDETATAEASETETTTTPEGTEEAATTSGDQGAAPSGELVGTGILEGSVMASPEWAVARPISVQLTGPIAEMLEMEAEGGNYHFEQLPPGLYSVLISAPGFIPQTIEVSLGVGETQFAPPVSLMAGDINQDGRVSLADLSIAAALLPETAVPPAPAAADYTGDGLVTTEDFDIIVNNFGL